MDVLEPKPMTGARSSTIIAVVLALLGGLAVAQEAADVPSEPVGPAVSSPASDESSPSSRSDAEGLSLGRMPTFKELFETSPYINTLILVLSVIAVVMFLYM